MHHLKIWWSSRFQRSRLIHTDMKPSTPVVCSPIVSPILVHYISIPFGTGKCPNACLTGCSLAGRLGFSDPIRLSSSDKVDAARADLPLYSVIQVYKLAYSTFSHGDMAARHTEHSRGHEGLCYPRRYPRSGRPASFLSGGVIGLRYV